MEDLSRKLTHHLDLYATHHPFSGVALIGRGEEIIFQKAYGLADRISGRANTLDTPFPIASLSKAFTALLCLEVCQQAGITPSQSAGALLPGFVSLSPDISLHHLLSHSSGLPDYRVKGEQPLHEIFANLLTPQEFWQQLGTVEQKSAPGEAFHYCNPGYYLLGLIIERLSGKSFGAALQDILLQPLGLAQTGLDDPEHPPANRARPYDYKGGEIIEAPFTDARNFYPQGGLYSTVADLHRWAGAHGIASSVPGRHQAQLFSPVIHSSVPRDIYYGYGWHRLTRHGKACVGHGGSHWGYRSHLEYYPESGWHAIVLSNYGFQDATKVADQLMQICFGLAVPEPQQPKPWTGPLEEMRPFLGRYGSETYQIEIQYRAEQYVLLSPQGETELLPMAPGKFRHVFYDEPFEVQEKAGKLYFWGMPKIS
ncbi:MAG: serine hydrolase domain-containing protein [Bacteroidota bacterium]